ncbi:hypothetical protein STEG23_020313 [Scotinomys teguina]
MDEHTTQDQGWSTSGANREQGCPLTQCVQASTRKDTQVGMGKPAKVKQDKCGKERDKTRGLQGGTVCLAHQCLAWKKCPAEKELSCSPFTVIHNFNYSRAKYPVNEPSKVGAWIALGHTPTNTGARDPPGGYQGITKMRTCGLFPGWYGLTSQDLLTALQMFQNPDQLQDNWLKDEASQTAPVKIGPSS